MSSLPDFPLPQIIDPRVDRPHRLQHTWALWVQKKSKKIQQTSWYDGTVCVGRFNTVEGFWQIYSHILRTEQLAGSVDVMLFKDGIKPFWEDDNNRYGGRWTMRISKKGASTVWEELLLALLGEQADTDICGAVLSIRYHDDHISVWNKSADNEPAVSAVRDVVMRTLNLPAWVPFDYTRHKHHDKDKQAHEAGAAGAGEQPAPIAPAAPAAAPVAAPVPAPVQTQGNGGWRSGPSSAPSGGRGPTTGAFASMSRNLSSGSGSGEAGPGPHRAAVPSVPVDQMEAVPLTLRRTTSAPAPAPSASEAGGAAPAAPAQPSSSGPSGSPWKPTPAWNVPEPQVEAGPGPVKNLWGGGQAAGPTPGQAAAAASGSKSGPSAGWTGAGSGPSGAPPPPMPSSAALGVGGPGRAPGQGGYERRPITGGPRPTGMAARHAQGGAAGKGPRPEGAGLDEDGWTTVPPKK